MTDFPLPAGLVATSHRFLWHPGSRTAILADLHLGAHAELSRRGIFMPDTTSAPLHAAFSQIAARHPARLIIAGDLFDSPTPDPEAQSLAHALLGTLPNCDITILQGNHDPDPQTLHSLFPSATIKRGHDSFPPALPDITITHGHQLPKNICATLIVGHQHPAVILQNRIQSAKMPCFALGTLPSKNPSTLILLPAFSRAPLGSNLLASGHWLLPIPRPPDADIQILGLIEPQRSSAPPQLLNFGPLHLLRPDP